MIFKGKQYAIVIHKTSRTCRCSNCDFLVDSLCTGRIGESIQIEACALCYDVEKKRSLDFVTFRKVK